MPQSKPRENGVGIDGFILFIQKRVDISHKDEEKIRLVYAFADFLHHHQERKDGTKFFEHPQEVARILLEANLRNGRVSTKQIIIALLHDIIEDTEVEHFILKNLFWKGIADSVDALSKKHWSDYIEDIDPQTLSQNQRNMLKACPQNLEIETIWKKKIKSKKIKTRISKTKKKITLFVDAQNTLNAWGKLEKIAELLQKTRVKVVRVLLLENTPNQNIWSIVTTISEIFRKQFDTFNIDIIPSRFSSTHPFYENLWEQFPDIRNMARSLRDEDYYGTMERLDDDTLDVKLADRIHNLRTTSKLTWEKILEIVQETEKYFLPVAKIRNKKMYAELIRLTTKLRSELVLKKT